MMLSKQTGNPPSALHLWESQGSNIARTVQIWKRGGGTWTQIHELKNDYGASEPLGGPKDPVCYHKIITIALSEH